MGGGGDGSDDGGPQEIVARGLAKSQDQRTHRMIESTAGLVSNSGPVIGCKHHFGRKLGGLAATHHYTGKSTLNFSMLQMELQQFVRFILMLVSAAARWLNVGNEATWDDNRSRTRKDDAKSGLMPMFCI
jgi:hypothetical protein